MKKTEQKMGAEVSQTQEEKPNSRRKFLKGSLAAAAGGIAAGMPMISVGAKPTVLKLQGAWGGGIFKVNRPGFRGGWLV